MPPPPPSPSSSPGRSPPPPHQQDHPQGHRGQRHRHPAQNRHNRQEGQPGIHHGLDLIDALVRDGLLDGGHLGPGLRGPLLGQVECRDVETSGGAPAQGVGGVEEEGVVCARPEVVEVEFRAGWAGQVVGQVGVAVVDLQVELGGVAAVEAGATGDLDVLKRGINSFNFAYILSNPKSFNIFVLL